MKLNRVVAYVMGVLAVILSLVAYMSYIYQLGFPDGFTTELGYTQRRLAYIFIGISVVLSMWFFYLGTVAWQRKIVKPLAATIIFYWLRWLAYC